MDEEAPLKVTHDVSQTLQRKIEGKFDYNETQIDNTNSDSGLEDVERAFVHVSPDSFHAFQILANIPQVDYDQDHDPHEEHKPVTPARKPKRAIKKRMEDAKKMMVTVIPGLGKN